VETRIEFNVTLNGNVMSGTCSVTEIVRDNSYGCRNGTIADTYTEKNFKAEKRN